MRVEFEWRPRHDFHEIAEALGVTTDHIMAVAPFTGDAITVLFTEEHAPDPKDSMIYSAWLEPDASGVLVASPRREVGSFGDFIELAT
jgi:hypothetical protein